MEKKYFTTPIYYVNDIPHIGHTYCTFVADCLARYWRKKLGKENVFFGTGTDENSQKTGEAAKKLGKEVSNYLDEISAEWKHTWDLLGIEYDDFIRTTQPRHHETVKEVLTKILQKGDIYKGKYEGKYCTGCETFLRDSDLDENGNCPDHKITPKKIEEENYFFTLKKYQKPLEDFYAQNPDCILPESKRADVMSFIASGLEDISISRENAELGIPLPQDERHKIYVWFDALINYYTMVKTPEREEFFHHTIHLLGKDITRFHCVIWPAMLMSADLPLPKHMITHGFFTVNGEKMSKSFGNTTSPLVFSQKYGNDAIRLGLLSGFELGNDGDFSAENFDNFYRTKLAGGVGNLFHRVLTLIQKFSPDLSLHGTTVAEKSLSEEFGKSIEAYKIKQAIDLFFTTVSEANQILNEKEPWKLVKTDPEAANKIFAQLLWHLQELSKMAEVILPETHKKMNELLTEENKNKELHVLFSSPKEDEAL